MKKRAIAGSLLFVLILGLVSIGTYRVLSWKDSKGIFQMYDCPADSVDVLFIGSSHSFCSVNTAILWEDYGIAANDFSENGQTLASEYFFLEEALKTQNPKIVFAELRGIDMPYNLDDGNIYRNTLNLNWSNNFLQNVKSVISQLKGNGVEPEQLENIQKGITLKFPVIHTRYNELSEEDFDQNHKLLRYSPNWSRKAYDIPDSLSTTDTAELSESQILAMEQLIKLSEENGFQLVFWVAPHFVNYKLATEYNAVGDYAKEKGVDYYGIQQMVEGAGFDFGSDMREEKYYGSHMNCWGAEKVTRYIGDLLKNNYGVQDHRNDAGYAWFDQMAREWDEECAIHDLSTADNLQDYAAALDRTFFDVTVINYLKQNSSRQTDWDMDSVNDEEETEEGIDGNLIINSESYEDWFVYKQEYISFPQPGTVMFSASNLTDFSFSRIEGPLSKKTEEIIGEDDYVLSFEVMSPDWSSVYEPTTDYTGLDAVAVKIATSDGSPLGKQLAYKFIRLGEQMSSYWREVPKAIDGEWLRYESVPLRFSSTKSTWEDLDKGIGQFLRVGPSLRSNGTVYFRNFKFERCDESNDREAYIHQILNSINDNPTDVAGLSTNASRNLANGVWELSSRVKLMTREDNIEQAKLYNNTNEIQINDCDVCTIVVDKETGKFIKKDEFSLTDQKLSKK